MEVRKRQQLGLPTSSSAAAAQGDDASNEDVGETAVITSLRQDLSRHARTWRTHTCVVAAFFFLMSAAAVVASLLHVHVILAPRALGYLPTHVIVMTAMTSVYVMLTRIHALCQTKESHRPLRTTMMDSVVLVFGLLLSAFFFAQHLQNYYDHSLFVALFSLGSPLMATLALIAEKFVSSSNTSLNKLTRQQTNSKNL